MSCVWAGPAADIPTAAAAAAAAAAPSASASAFAFFLSETATQCHPLSLLVFIFEIRYTSRGRFTSDGGGIDVVARNTGVKTLVGERRL